MNIPKILNRKEIRQCIENLGRYAVERQNGFQEHQQCRDEGDISDLGNRNILIRNIIGDMASFYNLPDKENLLADYDQRLAGAHNYSAVEVLSFEQQQEIIQTLRQYTAEQIIQAKADPRQELMNLRNLLGDMEFHWKQPLADLHATEKLLDALMIRQTVNQPIRFTRILLGEENGPHGEAFLSGEVTDAEVVARTALCNELTARYPEVPDWPAICTVYYGDNEDYDEPFHDATAIDMMIIRRYSGIILRQEGIQQVGNFHEMTLSSDLPDKDASFSMEQGL